MKIKEYYQHDSEEGRINSERFDLQEAVGRVFLIAVGVVGVFGAIRYWVG